ncbi:unnamed protein product [Closterium sp. Naga37s-1]|nr:unnamed protein product [Closterium sp. Naga37s-1]
MPLCVPPPNPLPPQQAASVAVAPQLRLYHPALLPRLLEARDVGGGVHGGEAGGERGTHMSGAAGPGGAAGMGGGVSGRTKRASGGVRFAASPRVVVPAVRTVPPLAPPMPYAAASREASLQLFFPALRQRQQQRYGGLEGLEGLEGFPMGLGEGGYDDDHSSEWEAGGAGRLWAVAERVGPVVVCSGSGGGRDYEVEDARTKAALAALAGVGGGAETQGQGDVGRSESGENVGLLVEGLVHLLGDAMIPFVPTAPLFMHLFM